MDTAPAHKPGRSLGGRGRLHQHAKGSGERPSQLDLDSIITALKERPNDEDLFHTQAPTQAQPITRFPSLLAWKSNSPLTNKQVLRFCISNGVAPLLRFFINTSSSDPSIARSLRHGLISGISSPTKKDQLIRNAAEVANKSSKTRQGLQDIALVRLATWAGVLYNKNKNGFFKHLDLPEHEALQVCARLLLDIFWNRQLNKDGFAKQLLASPLAHPMDANTRGKWEAHFLLPHKTLGPEIIEDGSEPVPIIDCDDEIPEKKTSSESGKPTGSKKTKSHATEFYDKEILVLAEAVKSQMARGALGGNYEPLDFSAVADLLPFRSTNDCKNFYHAHEYLFEDKTSDGSTLDPANILSEEDFLVKNLLVDGEWEDSWDKKKDATASQRAVAKGSGVPNKRRRASTPSDDGNDLDYVPTPKHERKKQKKQKTGRDASTGKAESEENVPSSRTMRSGADASATVAQSDHMAPVRIRPSMPPKNQTPSATSSSTEPAFVASDAPLRGISTVSKSQPNEPGPDTSLTKEETFTDKTDTDHRPDDLQLREQLKEELREQLIAQLTDQLTDQLSEQMSEQLERELESERASHAQEIENLEKANKKRTLQKKVAQNRSFASGVTKLFQAERKEVSRLATELDAKDKENSRFARQRAAARRGEQEAKDKLTEAEKQLEQARDRIARGEKTLRERTDRLAKADKEAKKVPKLESDLNEANKTVAALKAQLQAAGEEARRQKEKKDKEDKENRDKAFMDGRAQWRAGYQAANGPPPWLIKRQA